MIWLKKIVKSECEKYGEPKSLLLSLINCLYEADDLPLFDFVADLLKDFLKLSFTTMNPIDCLSVGYFVSVCTKHISLDVNRCSIGDQGCKFLARGFFKCVHSNHKVNRLDLTNNDIHEEGIRYIRELLTNSKISDLRLSGNAIGNDGLGILCKVLSTNTSLTHLWLNDCSLSLNDHGAIPQLLRTNTKLQHLDLSKNVLNDTELSKIFQALSTSTSLTHLFLNDCSLSRVSISSLPRPNTTLQRLDLSGNDISNAELNTLCDSLSTFASLDNLNLRNCSLTITANNGAALYQLLSNNHSLKVLNLSRNTVTSCHHIAAGLAVNKTLKILSLDRCKLTDGSIEELSTGLINNIERLDIESNDSITENGIKTLARHLTIHCSKLKKLWISERFRSSMKKVFKKTNQERKKNILAEIDWGFY